jgi:aminoglycoside phosphotransferase (APT) family kinase protein
MTRREAVERYGKPSGIEVSDVPYYYVFGIYKIAIVLQQIYVRFHRGQTQHKRFESMGQAAKMLFWKAKEQSEPLSL